ncbi:DNA replication licensing factor, putative [Eimeria brunetti]|uniref:DNA helicase n=1 Tax=Eimeria brunetti TaxID=51314 RepID=U6LB59_9EIME|nr:DNA replication licensing factor, putative [Eimeria brunetti]
MFEGERVYYSNTRSDPHGFEADDGGPDSLPSLKQARLFFEQYLHHGSGALRRKLLAEAEKSTKCLLELDLFDLIEYQHRVQPADLECVNTPLCARDRHRAPPDFAHRLARCLRERPLVYLPVCEKACEEIAAKSAIVQGAAEGPASKRERTFDVQINLIDSGKKPIPIRSLLSNQQEHFVVTTGIVISCKAPMSRMQDPYFIVSNECTFVDVQLLKMQELPEDVPTGDMPRHLLLNASRFLVDEATAGDRLLISGVLTTELGSHAPSSKDTYDQTGPQQAYIHVLGIRKINFSPLLSTLTSLEQRSLFQRLSQEPGIIDKITRSIAPALYGMEEVKRACACLLFGGTAKIINDTTRIRGDINVLLLGDPSVAKSQVLKFVSKLAPISVYTSGKGSSAAGLTAAVMRDRQGVFSLEGGCMCLADGGVVCVDEFDKMQERDVVAMHEAMEQQTISISKAGINTVLNSRCAVLAAANPSFGSFDDAQDTTEQHEFKATILSRFDLIFMLRDKDDYEKDTRLCEHILSLHARKAAPLAHEEGETIPFELLRRYIQYARQQQQPLLSLDARDALKNFYVQTRQDVREDRRSVTRKIPITLRQLESLVRIAESFARMELAPAAQASHVKRAIDLFSASTAETAKHALVFESLTPLQQKAIKVGPKLPPEVPVHPALAEDALMSRLQPGQRALRRNIVKDLQQQGYDKLVVQR